MFLWIECSLHDTKYLEKKIFIKGKVNILKVFQTNEILGFIIIFIYDAIVEIAIMFRTTTNNNISLD
jgi:hypothetical protein